MHYYYYYQKYLLGENRISKETKNYFYVIFPCVRVLLGCYLPTCVRRMSYVHNIYKYIYIYTFVWRSCHISLNYCCRIIDPIHSGVLSNFVAFAGMGKLRKAIHTQIRTYTHSTHAHVAQKGMNAHRANHIWIRVRICTNGIRTLWQYIYYEFMIINQNGMKCCTLRKSSRAVM